MSTAHYERDLAHEADMAELRREQLRGDMTVEEANAECSVYTLDAADYDDYFDDLGNQAASYRS